MPKKFVFRVDNINISINWILQGAPDSPLIGLYGRLTGTGEEGWMKFASSNETNINLGSPGFSWEFKANGTKIQPWMNPKIRISSSITVVKYSSKVAFASLNVTNFSSTQGLWNITYNNTISVNEFDNTTFRNVTFYQYKFHASKIYRLLMGKEKNLQIGFCILYIHHQVLIKQALLSKQVLIHIYKTERL
jgi:hypothetical protein